MSVQQRQQQQKTVQQKKFSFLRHSRCFGDIAADAEEGRDRDGEGVQPDDDHDGQGSGVSPDLALNRKKCSLIILPLYIYSFTAFYTCTFMSLVAQRSTFRYFYCISNVEQ
jgi:hypothetical protein